MPPKKSDGEKKPSDFEITPEENTRFEKAFKDPEFVKMFAEYMKEMADPENRKRQEEELRKLEEQQRAEGGSSIPGYDPQTAGMGIHQLAQKASAAMNSIPSTSQPVKTAPKKATLKELGPQKPKYQMLHSGQFDMSQYTNSREGPATIRPQHLVIKIELPPLQSAAEIDLEVEERLLTLRAKDLYHLDLPLSFPVDGDKGTAKFDKAKSTLTVTVPVLPPPPPVKPVSTAQIWTEADEKAEEEEELKKQEEEERKRKETAQLPPAPVSTASPPSKAPTISSETPKVIPLPDFVPKPDYISPAWPAPALVEYAKPPVEFKQNQSNITVVFRVNGVEPRSIKAHYEKKEFSIEFMANSSFYKFSTHLHGSIIPEECHSEPSTRTLILVLPKAETGLWSFIQESNEQPDVAPPLDVNPIAADLSLAPAPYSQPATRDDKPMETVETGTKTKPEPLAVEMPSEKTEVTAERKVETVISPRARETKAPSLAAALNELPKHVARGTPSIPEIKSAAQPSSTSDATPPPQSINPIVESHLSPETSEKFSSKLSAKASEESPKSATIEELPSTSEDADRIEDEDKDIPPMPVHGIKLNNSVQFELD